MGGLAALLFLELIVRVLEPEATRAALFSRLAGERSTWARPDAEFHHVGEGIFRLDFPGPSASPFPRIMVVGDSFVMGHGVGEEQRFGNLLQQRLGSPAHVDVLATSS